MTSTNGEVPSDLRVLIVDDERDVRLMLSLALPPHGIEVVAEAGNGQEALEQCAVHRPDAIVLDLLMPGTNGFEAIPRIRQQFPDIGIVAYTAVAGEFVRNEMGRLDVPLVLKQSSVVPLVNALRKAAEASAS